METKKQTILEWYRENLNGIDAPCGGRGDCGRCRIRFLSDAPKAGEKEKRLLTQAELAEGIRLACVTEKSDREDFVPVGDVSAEGKADVMGGDVKETSYGIALDLGTTTLAMRLVGLSSGSEIATITAMNHQRAYGADVISRIQAANEGKLKELQACIRNDITNLLKQLAGKTQINIEQIRKIAIAGNTTMCHLLLGYSCEGLGRAPYEPVDISLMRMEAGELFEKTEMQAEVILLPGISAFVGADIVAGIYHCDMDKKEETHMLLDIGTNGEIVLGGKNGFMVTSTAAGPVFEGGNISCGMPAVPGAAVHVKCKENFDGNGECRLKWQYEVLGQEGRGGLEPAGFSGSGLVDLAACFLEKRLIDENGTLCDEYFDSGYPVTAKLNFLQADLRELQMGKAAIRAGVELLCKQEMPERIYLAGGFGSALDVESAIKIGLFAEDSRAKITPSGNTVLEGLHRFLTDESGEERVQKIAAGAKEVLLAEEAGFEEAYIAYMQFVFL